MATAVLPIEQELDFPETTFDNQAPVDLLVDEPAHAEFSDEERESFHRDDAMAAGMVSVILTLAFLVLVALAIGVTAWTVANV